MITTVFNLSSNSSKALPQPRKALSMSIGDAFQVSSIRTSPIVEREREREKKDTKQLYRFLPQTGSSPIPLALPRSVH